MNIKRLFWDDYLGMTTGLSFILIILLILNALILGIRQLDYHYSSTYCMPKLKQIHREGKFVQYNFWEYDCLVKTSDGTYIPLDNLYNNVQENNVKPTNTNLDTKEGE